MMRTPHLQRVSIMKSRLKTFVEEHREGRSWDEVFPLSLSLFLCLRLAFDLVHLPFPRDVGGNAGYDAEVEIIELG